MRAHLRLCRNLWHVLWSDCVVSTSAHILATPFIQRRHALCSVELTVKSLKQRASHISLSAEDRGGRWNTFTCRVWKLTKYSVSFSAAEICQINTLLPRKCIWCRSFSRVFISKEPNVKILWHFARFKLWNRNLRQCQQEISKIGFNCRNCRYSSHHSIHVMFLFTSFFFVFLSGKICNIKMSYRPGYSSD